MKLGPRKLLAIKEVLKIAPLKTTAKTTAHKQKTWAEQTSFVCRILPLSTQSSLPS